MLLRHNFIHHDGKFEIVTFCQLYSSHRVVQYNRRRRDHPHCCGSEPRVDDVILLHCSLFIALLTQSAIVIPVHSFTSSTHHLLGLSRALFPSTYPWHMNAGNLSALIMCPK